MDNIIEISLKNGEKPTKEEQKWLDETSEILSEEMKPIFEHRFWLEFIVKKNMDNLVFGINETSDGEMKKVLKRINEDLNER